MEIINAVLFYIAALMLIISSIMAIISTRIMNSVFFATAAFFLFGFLFFALNAPFNGVIQISIYGIALSVLFVTAIMLTDYKNENKTKNKIYPGIFLIISGIFMIVYAIIYFIRETIFYDINIRQYIFSSHILTSLDTTKQLSSELLRHNLYSFEILGIYLLIAMIGISALLIFTPYIPLKNEEKMITNPEGEQHDN